MKKYVKQFLTNVWHGVLAVIGGIIVIIGGILIVFPIPFAPAIIAFGLSLILGPRGYKKFEKAVLPWLKNHKIHRKRL